MTDPAETGTAARWRIEELHAAAERAGDAAAASVCERALDGDADALRAVAEIIEEVL